jgi:predicted transcriptional regulator
MIVTFEELRKVKDSLPHGSMQKIASDLGVDEQTVKNYFGDYHFRHGGFAGVHYEPGPNGGVVMLDDDIIYQKALSLIEDSAHKLINKN